MSSLLSRDAQSNQCVTFLCCQPYPLEQQTSIMPHPAQNSWLILVGQCVCYFFLINLIKCSTGRLKEDEISSSCQYKGNSSPRGIRLKALRQKQQKLAASWFILLWQKTGREPRWKQEQVPPPKAHPKQPMSTSFISQSSHNLSKYHHQLGTKCLNV